jgi:lysozyme family protein
MSEQVFLTAFGVVVGEEGNFSCNTADPGNWTSGQCGVGRCVGTKFGVSAAAYPTLDVVNLTIADAQAIYRRDYWERVQGDALPPPLALLVFDAAVNNGTVRAIRWLQQAVGVSVDGVLGQVTLAAVSARSGSGAAILAEFQAQRMTFMAGLPTWRTFGLGWARRLCRLPFDAIQMGIK